MSAIPPAAEVRRKGKLVCLVPILLKKSKFVGTTFSAKRQICRGLQSYCLWSGNPKGRVSNFKIPQNIRDLFSEHSEKAVKVIVETMEDKDTPAHVKIACTEHILDRAYGKLKANIIVEGVGLVELLAGIAEKRVVGEDRPGEDDSKPALH